MGIISIIRIIVSLTLSLSLPLLTVTPCPLSLLMYLVHTQAGMYLSRYVPLYPQAVHQRMYK